MKTQVETYELTDVKDETEQQSAEAIALCEQLGLKGQLEKTSTSVQTRFPYRLVTDEESFVYSTLCPEKCNIDTYSNEPIPLDVLKTVAYAKSLDVFEQFEVWSASSARVKDPVVVAYKRGERYSNKRYLLARWGAELLPLTVLLADAVRVWAAARKTALLKLRADIDTELAYCANPGETVPNRPNGFYL